MMRICLVTTFPPSHGGLNEYGLHIAQELRRNPFINLTILADEVSGFEPELDGFRVVRCWSADRPASIVRLMTRLREQKPDVVWFNLLFSTFGNNPLNAFAGLMIPFLTRMSGRYTHVTLHHLMDTVDLDDLGVRFTHSYRFAGAIATRMLLLANSVSVLMPRYREILSEKYGGDNVHVRSHGILTRCPQPPDFSRRGNPVHRILAFGKWGTYKRLELMIEAFRLISEKLPNAKLVIAGGNHPQAVGYVESVREKCVTNPDIEFTGYVDEERLADLFQTSSVAVMPYSSSTGCSGVAHLACAYSVPVVCAALPDFRQMADGEDLAIEFYRAGDAQDLADCLVKILQSPEDLRAMALQNFSAALRMTMPAIVQKYLRHFQLQQQIEALRQVAKVRKLPDWVPSKGFLLRAVTRTWKTWLDNSPIFRPWSNRTEKLLHDDGDGGGNLHGTAAPIGESGVIGQGRAKRGQKEFARQSVETDSTHADARQSMHGSPISSSPAAQHQSDDAEGQQADGDGSGMRSARAHLGSSNGNGRNPEIGNQTSAKGSDRDRKEEATPDAREMGAGE
jgi:glycosyltransferase involved in cell wall biosynthesis